MKAKIILILSLLCLVATGCKHKPATEELEMTVEPFELHPTWTDSDTNNFWD